MGMTPEGKIKKQVDTMLSRLGVYYFSPQSGIYGRSGVPDRIACVAGIFVAIECKADAKKKPTALQDHQMANITTAGGHCFVVYDTKSIDWCRTCLVSIMEEANKIRLEERIRGLSKERMGV